MIITLIFWYSMSSVAGIPKALLFPASLMLLLLCDVLECLMLLASFQLLKRLLLLASLMLLLLCDVLECLMLLASFQLLKRLLLLAPLMLLLVCLSTVANIPSTANLPAVASISMES